MIDATGEEIVEVCMDAATVRTVFRLSVATSNTLAAHSDRLHGLEAFDGRTLLVACGNHVLKFEVK
jgi:hypothetical protein